MIARLEVRGPARVTFAPRLVDPVGDPTLPSSTAGALLRMPLALLAVHHAVARRDVDARLPLVSLPAGPRPASCLAQVWTSHLVLG